MLTNRTTALVVYTILKSRLIADWSVENIKLTLSKNLVLLAVSVLQEKK